MIQAKCIQKFKKNNHIYAYRLQDFQGNTKDVYSDQLKQAIRSNKINIVNLTLTSDNRLVDTTQPQKSTTQTKPSKISKEQIQKILTKAKLLGLPTKEITTACNHRCYLISMSEVQHIVYIPDDVTKLNNDLFETVFTDSIQDLQGSIKIFGGKNLKGASFMFMDCQAQSLDLSNFDTSNVTNMCSMFRKCETQYIDLSSFDTSKVIAMDGMFYACQAKSLDLSNFDTSHVTDMATMFYDCQAQSLDLSNFDTSKVTNMDSMFRECQAQYIDLSNFDTSHVTEMQFMFENCQAKSLDLSSFNTSKVKEMNHIFYRCYIKIKATDPKLLNEIRNLRQYG